MHRFKIKKKRFDKIEAKRLCRTLYILNICNSDTVYPCVDTEPLYVLTSCDIIFRMKCFHDYLILLFKQICTSEWPENHLGIS